MNWMNSSFDAMVRRGFFCFSSPSVDTARIGGGDVHAAQRDCPDRGQHARPSRENSILGCGDLDIYGRGPGVSDYTAVYGPHTVEIRIPRHR